MVLSGQRRLVQIQGIEELASAVVPLHWMVSYRYLDLSMSNLKPLISI